MDPLSVVGSVLAITAAGLQTSKKLNDLRNKYELASLTLTSICTEATIISASMSQIQQAILKDTESFGSVMQKSPELANTMDTALIGSSVVFAALNDELEKLEVEIFKCSTKPNFKTKIKFLWREDIYNSLLSQLRGQHQAISVLLQMLQMESMSGLTNLIKNSHETLERLAKRTMSLRHSYPDIKVPRSLFESDGDDVSVYSGTASTAGATEFDFDAFIIDSKVYRRAFAGGYLRPRRVSFDADDDDDANDTATIRESEGAAEEDTNGSTDNLSGTTAQGVAGAGSDDEDAKSVRTINGPPKQGQLLEVNAPDGGKVAMNSKEVSLLLQDYGVLRGKYQKVKKYYFEHEGYIKKMEEILIRDPAGLRVHTVVAEEDSVEEGHLQFRAGQSLTLLRLLNETTAWGGFVSEGEVHRGRFPASVIGDIAPDVPRSRIQKFEDGRYIIVY